MSTSSVLFYAVLLVASCVVSAREQLDAKKLVPLHYTIDLALDIATNKFHGEGSISISVLKETNEISLFKENSLQVAWSSKPMLISDETGQEYKSFMQSTVLGTDSITYFYESDVSPGNYTLLFREVDGTIGLPHSGFQRVPLRDEAGNFVG